MAKHRTCKCGAKTAQEHFALVLNGHKVHTYGGPRQLK